jgi:hypothetical protein
MTVQITAPLQNVLFKRTQHAFSMTAGVVPQPAFMAEITVNVADKKFYTSDATGNVYCFLDLVSAQAIIASQQAALDGLATSKATHAEVQALVAQLASAITALNADHAEIMTVEGAEAALAALVTQMQTALTSLTLLTGNKADSTALAALAATEAQHTATAAAHAADLTNPHDVTKAQVGLANADNTSDVNKPVSGPQAAALSAGLATKAASNIILTPEMYGPVGTADDTATLQLFLTALRDGGIGSWGNRSYNIRENVLILQPSADLVDTQGPTLIGACTLIGLGVADGPYLKIWNATYNPLAGGGKYYKNLVLGSINMRAQSSLAGAIATHGVSFRGVFGARWELISVDGLRGDGINVPQATVSGNPDYYEVAYCSGTTFVKNCFGKTVNNLNGAAGAGVSGTISGYVNGGGYANKGGQGTVMVDGSFGGTTGWAVDWSKDVGSGNRHRISRYEMDTVEYGILIGAVTNCVVEQTRINYRINAGACWPKTAIKIGHGTIAGHVDDNINSVSIDAIIRIEPAITLAMLQANPIIDMTGAYNVSNVDINLTILDNANTGYQFADIVKNIAASAGVKIVINGVCYVNQKPNSAAAGHGSAASRIPVTGVGAATSRITSLTQRVGLANMWSATAGCVQIVQPGNYVVSMNFIVPIGAAAGQAPANARARYGIYFERSGVPGAIIEVDENVPAAGVNYTLSATGVAVALKAGDLVYPVAVIAAAAQVAVTGILGYPSSNQYSVIPLSH